MSADFSTLKCYMGDTGLLVSHAFGANRLAVDDIHRRIMFGSISLNEGMLVENVVAQMLAARDLELFFYARSDRKQAENRMEIDFLLANEEMKRKKNVSAVEVKSEKDYSTDSLGKFCRKFKSSLGPTYILHPGDVSEKGDVIRLPLYMTPWIELKHM